MGIMKGHFYSVLSGLIASLASLSGKYAMAYEEAQNLCEMTLHLGDLNFTEVKNICVAYLSIVRIFFIILMFLFNCVMWTTFTKALRFSSTSLEATIINTASNFFLTAVVSQVLFNEIVTGLWWMGTILILCGLVIMHHSRNILSNKQNKKRKVH